MKISINKFLEKIEQFVDNDYGRTVRTQFKDNAGSSELAMLASPKKDEIEQITKALAVMTKNEKDNAETLSDRQVRKIAEDAGIDPAVFAIFINGYALHCKRVS